MAVVRDEKGRIRKVASEPKSGEAEGAKAPEAKPPEGDKKPESKGGSGLIVLILLGLVFLGARQAPPAGGPNAPIR